MGSARGVTYTVYVLVLNRAGPGVSDGGAAPPRGAIGLHAARWVPGRGLEIRFRTPPSPGLIRAAAEIRAICRGCVIASVSTAAVQNADRARPELLAPVTKMWRGLSTRLRNAAAARHARIVYAHFDDGHAFSWDASGQARALALVLTELGSANPRPSRLVALIENALVADIEGNGEVGSASNPTPQRAVAPLNRTIVAPPSSGQPAVVTGIPIDGKTLSTSTGSWSGTSPIAYAYQWQRCDPTGSTCTDIAGASGATHSLTPADVGSTLRSVVTASNAAGSQTATSAVTATVGAAAPQLTQPPAITGTPIDGQTLSTSTGSWSGTPTIAYAYQWQRCDTTGSTCANIVGASGATYSLAPADVGSTLRTVVTATNAGGSQTAKSAVSFPAAAAAPQSTSAPAISGTPIDGQTLSTSTGSWSGTPTIAYAYQWQRCDTTGSTCANIVGASGATYSLTPADVGSTLRAVVTATNAAGPQTATSTPSMIVRAAAPAVIASPALSGIAIDGQALSTSSGSWSGTPTITYAYQWQRCDSSGAGCADIPGASNPTYSLTPADVGGTLRTVVTATNAAGSQTATSAVSATIGAAAPQLSQPPAITGTPIDGQTLSTSSGSWSGTPTIAYVYQWQRCDSTGAGCADIPSASNPTYSLTPADVGSTLRSVVTATNAGGSQTATSAVSFPAAAAAPHSTSAPAITGTPTDGQTLSTSTGSWSGTPTIAYTYQWRRCDSSGAGCADIPGASNPTYSLTPADVGGTLRTVVTATNAAGPQTATSNPSTIVRAAAPAVTAGPALSGIAIDGQALSTSSGSWSGTPPIAYAYQWQRCDSTGSTCANIVGASGATYSLTPADVGGTLRSVVTASNAAGSQTATSAASAPIGAAAPQLTQPPAITGTPIDGQTLSTSSGSWSGTPTIAYAYQWQRCDSTGSTCANIAGAFGATYSLTPADVGSTLRTVVTATNAGGSQTATSAVSFPAAAAAPQLTQPPAITGTPTDGQALSTTTGSWSGTPTIAYTYQWQRCDSTGSTCANIAGASGATYSLTPADVGSTLRTVVTATNAGGSQTSTSAVSAPIGAAAPQVTQQPAITGTPEVGQALSASTGAWTGTAPIAYTFAWQRCDASGAACTEVANASAQSYVFADADVGHTLRVAVTATNAGGSQSATSGPSGVVGAPQVTVAPVISGTAVDGQMLSVTTGTWTGAPTSAYSYQWQRCDPTGSTCTTIANASSATYSLTPADVGSTLQAVVTATNAAVSQSVTSGPSATVAAAAPQGTAAPAISGTPTVGQTLSTATGSWTGTPTISYTYQWQRCDATGAGCANIATATGPGYLVVNADAWHALRVVVTATNAGGSQSAASQPVTTGSQLFALDSVWNAPLTTNAPLDTSGPARMSAFAQEIRNEESSGLGPWVQTSDSSTPLYIVDATTPRVPVKIDAGAWNANLVQALAGGVPIPNGAKPASGTDKHITIYEPDSDTLWELWHANVQADGWHADYGGAMQNVSQAPGYYTDQSWPGLSSWNWGATGTSLPVIAGTVTIADLRSGAINHALAVDIPAACSGYFSWPAQRSDGKDTSTTCLPEGAHLRLDPNINVRSMGLPKIDEELALAAQTYGLIVRDQTGHGSAFYFEDETRYGQPDPYYGANGYFGGLNASAVARTFPWFDSHGNSNLQLLQMKTCTTGPCGP